MPLFQTISRLHRTTRLLIALSLSLALYLALRFMKTGGAFSFLYAWILFAAVVLFFAWTTIAVNNPATVGAVASEQDNSPLVTFLFVVGAAFISLFAVLALLKSLANAANGQLTRQHILLSVVAVVCSWALIHTLFTLRYAHLYYTYPTHAEKAQENPNGGLAFPGNQPPDLLDFAYFSFTLGMAFQVSDVAVTDRSLRRLVMVQALLSFVYNTVIVAFSINILSGIIGK